MRLADLAPVKLLLPAIPLIVVAIAPASSPSPVEAFHTIGSVERVETPKQTPPKPPTKIDCRYPRPTPVIST
jgi:hypothetical protein